jgi:hypothetical protein
MFSVSPSGVDFLFVLFFMCCNSFLLELSELAISLLQVCFFCP